jgi:oligoribonuclease (3'-5' exoribonuclease)
MPQPRPATIAPLGDIQDSIAELAYYRQSVFTTAQNDGNQTTA